MELETKCYFTFDNQIDKFFYATMCHVCKRFGDGVQLKRCGGCWMIAYCGKEHQKQHWKQHKHLCTAIQDVLRDYSINYRGETTEEWNEKKLTFMKLVFSRLGRPLYKYETDMFCFPKECLVCYERNIKSLESCQKCAASFCQNHKDGIDHRNICAPLELYLYTNLVSIEEGKKPWNVVLQYENISCTSTFQNMKDVIKTLGNIQTDSEMSCNAGAAIVSEYLTHSLTLFYALRLLNAVPKSKDLVVHVLGATTSEEIMLIGWEILPRLIETMMSVVVIVIGPEIPCKSNLLNNCDNFMSREKCLTFEFHDVLYENYVSSSSFVKPDLVVTFNPCIEKHKLRSSEETWAPSIKLIAKQNCPFILTSPTLCLFKVQTDMINTILNKKVDHLYSGENPFASLYPIRYIAPEHILYMNQYVIIYKNLCS